VQPAGRDGKKEDIEALWHYERKLPAHFGDTESALRAREKLIGTKIAEHEELVRSIASDGPWSISIQALFIYEYQESDAAYCILERGGKKTEFLIENVRLLNDKELNSWKSSNLKNVSRDISVFIPAGSDAEVIKSVYRLEGRDRIRRYLDTYKKK